MVIKLKKEKLQVAVLVGLVLFGVCFVYITYLLQPQLANLSSKQKEIASKQEEYKQLQTYSADPFILNKEIQTQEVELSKIAKSLPITLDRPVIAYNIYTTLKRYNLVSESITFEKPEKKVTYLVMGLSFSVLGSSKDIIAMIDELQKSSDALVLRSITFKAQDKALRADLKLQVFARLGSKDSKAKPPFMTAAFGIDSIPVLFSPSPSSGTGLSQILNPNPAITLNPSAFSTNPAAKAPASNSATTSKSASKSPAATTPALPPKASTAPSSSSNTNSNTNSNTSLSTKSN